MSTDKQSDPLLTPFLVVASPEIRDVLRWSEKSSTAPPNTVRFAEGFLGSLIEDQAVIPVMSDPVAVLSQTLTHHLWRPETAAAWLNLGLALRRMALYRVDDAESRNEERLHLALSSLDRALAVAPELKVTAIRAWCGKALVHCQRGNSTAAVECVRRALDRDESDPSLWLLYSSMLARAERKDEAVEAIQAAKDAYIAAGRPTALDHIFSEGH